MVLNIIEKVLSLQMGVSICRVVAVKHFVSGLYILIDYKILVNFSDSFT